jgi:hypothetical protein
MYAIIYIQIVMYGIVFWFSIIVKQNLVVKKVINNFLMSLQFAQASE